MHIAPIDLAVGALAVWHIVEVWHHGSIFATWRARLELSDHFFARLLKCPFCLSLWVAFLVMPFMMPPIEPVETHMTVYANSFFGAGYMVFLAFAIARLANLGNDLTSKWCRTPDRKGLEPDSNSTIEKSDERPDRSTVPDPAGTPPDFR